jgi:hypothetical protein
VFIVISDDGLADLTIAVPGDAIVRGDLILPDYLAG